MEETTLDMTTLPRITLKNMPIAFTEEDVQMCKRNASIPTEEIEKDIVDTEVEISNMKVEAEHLEKTPLSMREARWDHMRASARKSGIHEREQFIEKLKKILAYRKVNNEK